MLKRKGGRDGMRYFSFETSLSTDEIHRRCFNLIEYERHSPWNVFTRYVSSRRGLHLYQHPNGFRGYFESGERGRFDSLQSAKVWTTFRITEKNGKRVLSGITYFCPLFSLLFFVVAVDILFHKNIIALVPYLLIFFAFLFFNLREETETVARIQALLAE
jgi:hypothetical protein